MKIIFYIDTFFFMNLCMDLIILTILSKVCKEKTATLRLLAAGGAGAFGACIIIMFPRMNRVLRFCFIYMILVGFMIRIAFTYRGVKDMIKQIICFYLITFLFGGILSFIYNNSSLGTYLANLQHTGNPKRIYLTVILVTIIIAVLLLPFLENMLYELKSRRNKIFPVELMFEGQSIKLEGLIDTGNLLKEPISGKPVIIGEYDALKPIIPLEVMHYKTKLKVIPYHSIGKKDGMLYGLTFDSVTVRDEKGLHKNGEAIVALYHGRLSSRGDYQLILYEECLNNYGNDLL